MKAQRVMTKNVVCIGPEATLDRAWGLMQRLHIRHLPVTWNEKLVGIVSDRDLLLRCTREQTGRLSFPSDTIGQAMTLAPVTCPPSARISRIAALMIEHRIDCVPIVAVDTTLMGLITSTDLIELLKEPEGFSDEVLPFDFALKVEANAEV